MAWPTIGSQTFLEMQGLPRTMSERFDELMRPGIDGQGYRKTGLYGQPFTLATVTDMSTASAIDSKLNTYKQMIGTTVTVSDALGNGWPKMFIVGVELIRSYPVGASTPGPNGTPHAMMECLWTMQCNV